MCVAATIKKAASWDGVQQEVSERASERASVDLCTCVRHTLHVDDTYMACLTGRGVRI